MESQQRTCYTDLKGNKKPKLKKKKELSQLNAGRREKSMWNSEEGNIYNSVFITFSKTGLHVYSPQIPMTAQVSSVPPCGEKKPPLTSCSGDKE